MQYVITYGICPQCGGSGEQYTGGGSTGSGPFPCTWPGCLDDPVGYVEIGSTKLDPCLGDILDKVNDVLDKCNDILAEVQGE